MATSRKPAATTSRASKSRAPAQVDSAFERITLLAYLKAESRGFAPGHELDDWLEAEQEVNGSGASSLEH
jgi:hypothetical protein